ncbi:MAG: ATP-dependent metallopeptidase FtsH/Yme1/Tma family protein [Candidatus Pacebacteria bacterium]|nr:ATP-dependent metallopeptidase FtsH/Yme1/Tma family protein [Candidatus Paceibacterota bacterium]
MKLLYKNIAWTILALVALSFIFSLIADYNATPKALSLNDLVSKINTGEVASIIVHDDTLDITLTDKTVMTAQKEAEASLTETLKNYGVESVALAGVPITVEDRTGGRFWASILIPTLLPLIAMIVIFWFIFRQAKGGQGQAFSFGKAGIKLFTSDKDSVTFKDVAGLKETKQELEEIVDFLKNPKKFIDMGARIPRGVLLMGAPGTGKTLLARAVAGESNVPFFHISASEFVEMFVGVGASRTRDAFATAKKSAPSILFIDEIDAIGRARGTGMGGGHDEREQTLNQILVEMDGFERDTQVIVLAATNRADVLDEALLRPGRFDRRITLDNPDINDREAILKIHSKDKPLEKTVDLRKVATRTPGFSGADLANLMNEAAIYAARNNRQSVIQGDIYNSIEKVLMGPERRGKAVSAKEREITAYHEAGHALVAASLKNSDPVHKVSIVSRGYAGGYTMKLPLEDEHLRTRSQFMADLAMMLGGYAAEEAMFGEMSTGASNDLQKVSDLARRLVTHYGMSEKLGPITFGKSTDMILLGREFGGDKNYSETVATQIDEEVRIFIARGYATAKKIISTRKKVLEAVANALLEKEVLEQEEFNAVIAPFKLKPLLA